LVPDDSLVHDDDSFAWWYLTALLPGGWLRLVADWCLTTAVLRGA
jgi:predicted secreted hydrolase